MEQMHINFTHFKSEISLMNNFDTEDKCKAAIAQERWGDGAVVCPYCGCTHTYMTKEGYDHLIVNHGKREFVRCKDIHTNSIEGFWGHFKRVIFSTYHCVSKDYVQRYIDEQSYRWNTREEKSSYRFHDMFVKAVKHFDYNDVLSLSSVVDIEYRTFKNRVYYAWYTRNDVA